jgi:hypothetical protein
MLYHTSLNGVTAASAIAATPASPALPLCSASGFLPFINSTSQRTPSHFSICIHAPYNHTHPNCTPAAVLLVVNPSSCNSTPYAHFLPPPDMKGQYSAAAVVLPVHTQIGPTPIKPSSQAAPPQLQAIGCTAGCQPNQMHTPSSCWQPNHMPPSLLLTILLFPSAVPRVQRPGPLPPLLPPPLSPTPPPPHGPRTADMSRGR